MDSVIIWIDKFSEEAGSTVIFSIFAGATFLFFVATSLIRLFTADKNRKKAYFFYACTAGACFLTFAAFCVAADCNQEMLFCYLLILTALSIMFFSALLFIPSIKKGKNANERCRHKICAKANGLQTVAQNNVRNVVKHNAQNFARNEVMNNLQNDLSKTAQNVKSSNDGNSYDNLVNDRVKETERERIKREKEREKAAEYIKSVELLNKLSRGGIEKLKTKSLENDCDIRRAEKPEIDFSHVKSVLERLSCYELSPEDEKQISALKQALYKAENYGYGKNERIEINDGLSGLLKIMSRYGV